ncbi:MAG: DNA-binding domain-containing protein [Rhizobiaceae bacterium]
MSDHPSPQPSIMAAFSLPLLDPDVGDPHIVSGPGGNPAPRRFAVYRNNVVVGLMDAVRAGFPSCMAIMGDENSARIIRNYVATHPPHSPLMQAYGHDFPDFLASFPPLKKSPFLADVARLEYAWLSAWHAADAPALEPGHLAGISEAELLESSLRPHPAASLITSPFPIHDLFQWRNERPEEGADLSRAQSVLVSRPALDVILTSLSPCQSDFFNVLLSGGKLGEAIASGLETTPDFDIQDAMLALLGSGAFLAPFNQHEKVSE